MRLLFLTQVLDADDAVLGFVVRWIAGLASATERVRVVALEVGDTTGLPPNVDWRAVGRKGRAIRWLRYRRYLREAFRDDGFDAVLAHMVPRYSLVAHGPARRAGAREYLWYTHGGVDRRLVRAVGLVERVFTASPESMRVEADNVVVTGHGIDVEHFRADGGAPDEPARILSVGRMTPRKDPLCVLEALALLAERGRNVHLDWAGGGLAAGDLAYGRRVEATIRDRGLRDRVTLHGDVSYRRIPELYRRSSVLVNASLTGSVDKVVLEAMASGRPVVTCNESFGPLFGELGADAQALAFPPGDAAALADRIEGLLDLSVGARTELGERLRAIVQRDHEVDGLMRRLVDAMEAV